MCYLQWTLWCLRPYSSKIGGGKSKEKNIWSPEACVRPGTLLTTLHWRDLWSRSRGNRIISSPSVTLCMTLRQIREEPNLMWALRQRYDCNRSAIVVGHSFLFIRALFCGVPLQLVAPSIGAVRQESMDDRAPCQGHNLIHNVTAIYPPSLNKLSFCWQISTSGAFMLTCSRWHVRIWSRTDL